MIWLITLGVFPIFGRCLNGEFLFDDPAIKDMGLETGYGRLRTLADLAATQSGRSITHWTYTLSYRMSGFKPWSWHLFNLIVHAATVPLVYTALAPYLAPNRALLAAAIWAWHPLQAASVCYISARASLLGVFFALCGLALFQIGGAWPLFLATIASFLSCKCKPDSGILLAFYPIAWLLSVLT